MRDIAITLLAFALSCCSGRLNEDLREMVASKPHDERLYGWWKMVMVGPSF